MFCSFNVLVNPNWNFISKLFQRARINNNLMDCGKKAGLLYLQWNSEYKPANLKICYNWQYLLQVFSVNIMIVDSEFRKKQKFF